MSETKFKPGPWHAGMRNGHNGNMVFAYDGEDAHNDTAIAQVYGLSINRSLKDLDSERGIHNAHLIASAPALYEALSRIVDDLPSNRDWLDPTLEAMARAALKAARGEA